MPRANTNVPSHSRRKGWLDAAKGSFGSKKSLIRTVYEHVRKSKQYAYRDRKNLKRDIRRLWIIRINAAVHKYGLSYSRFINALDVSGIEINRKMLAELAVNHEQAFEAIVKQAQNAAKQSNAA
jgi:large subunit ribosomal protein L20